MEQEAGDADHHLPQGAEPAANAECVESAEPQAESHAGGVEDLVVVNEEAVEKLTEGLISHYLPQLQTSKRALQELTQNQVILLETLEQEITKFRECNTIIDLNSLFTEAKVYHNKLVNIRKEMITLHDKTSKLKKRALKLQQQRQREALEREQQRERELERERQLIAKPAKRT
ncbi:biogenesis of lysosome-related organelles complex 1 subunit 6 [Pygocentrus nattereri]|uniref:biogenesis of lysosome-related organelles complex 1 subunit 6 n=1 Tax=Pygocentrus nattereri TaxID=42514 RepID=UPI0008146D05|nr:biogenesis of lysosome-related organelles complex 1 subunit 6 [Pygocentrus nattereri]